MYLEQVVRKIHQGEFYMKLFLLCGLLSIACLSSADTLKVAADPWCPYTCEKSSGKSGYLVDVLESIFVKAGHKIDYQVFAWPKVLNDTRKGDLNAAVGAGETDKEGLLFTKESLVKSQSCFFVKSNNNWKFERIESLKEITLGIIQGYTFETKIDEYIASAGNKVDAANVDNSLEANLKKLAAGRIDAYLEDVNVVDYAKNLNADYKEFKSAGCLDATPLFIGFSAKNTNSITYKEILEKGIAELKANGELKKIAEKYSIKLD